MNGWVCLFICEGQNGLTSLRNPYIVPIFSPSPPLSLIPLFSSPTSLPFPSPLGINRAVAEEAVAGVLGQVCRAMEVIARKPSQAILMEELRQCTQDAAQVVRERERETERLRDRERVQATWR